MNTSIARRGRNGSLQAARAHSIAAGTMNSRNGVPQCSWMCDPEISAKTLTNTSGVRPNDSSRVRPASPLVGQAVEVAVEVALSETARRRRSRWPSNHSTARNSQAGRARFSNWSAHQRATSCPRASHGRPAASDDDMA